jgi:membrane protease YdiL (CAAX protease family)
VPVQPPVLGPPDDPPGDEHPLDRPTRNRPAPLLVERVVALFEVLLCSGYPTQLAIGGTLNALGYGAFDAAGGLNLRYVALLSLFDALAVVGLVLIFLAARGERPRDVILGRRPVASEAVVGVPMTFVALGIAFGVVLAVRAVAPWLHTVENNPLQDLLKSPRDAGVFALVVVIAGGVREEVQRAFALHRFDVWLGGGSAGVVVTSVAFGAGHFVLQGGDVAVATGLLGAFWGVVYLRRRSAVAPIVSHAGFDLIQIAGFFAAQRL